MQNQDFLSFFNKLNLITFALILSPVITFTIIFILKFNGIISIEGFSHLSIYFLFAHIGVASSLAFLSVKITDQLILKINPEEHFDVKCHKYLTATIARFAMLEAGAFLGIPLYIFTSNIAFIMISMCMVGLMSINIPKKTKCPSSYW